jgi:hypothetical protein
VPGSISRADASPGDCPVVSVACISGYHYDGNGACVPLGTCGVGFSVNVAGLCCMSALSTNAPDAGVGGDAPYETGLYLTDASPKNTDGGTDVLDKQDTIGSGPAVLAITPSSPSFTAYLTGCGDATAITTGGMSLTITNVGGSSSGTITMTGPGPGWQVWQECVGTSIQPGWSCQLSVGYFGDTWPGQVTTNITVGDGVTSATATITYTIVEARSCPDAGVVRNDGSVDTLSAGSIGTGGTAGTAGAGGTSGTAGISGTGGSGGSIGTGGTAGTAGAGGTSGTGGISGNPDAAVDAQVVDAPIFF